MGVTEAYEWFFGKSKMLKEAEKDLKEMNNEAEIRIDVVRGELARKFVVTETLYIRNKKMAMGLIENNIDQFLEELK